MMNAKEFWISKYPDAEKDWGNTGHDDRFPSKNDGGVRRISS
jgi:hypothetical protein